MRVLLREAVSVVVPLAVVAACFIGLVRHPGWLLVDADRAGIDRAGPPGLRGVGNDLTSYGLPRYVRVVGQLRDRGRVSAWDPSGFGGRPFVGNPQSGRFYPPVWAAWWAACPSALGWLTVGHLGWTAVGACILARRLGGGRVAGVVAGGCYAASPYLMAHVFEGHYPHVWAACWYPWAFWGFLEVRRGHVWGYLGLPMAVAACFLTGHPQEWYYLVVVLGVWSMADAWSRWRDGRRGEAARGLAIGLGLLGLAVAACAVELLPELEAQRWTLRRGAIPLRAISRYTVHTVNLFQLISPFALGGPHDYVGHDNYWETVLSAGLVPLVLAAVGAVRHPARSARRGLLVLIAAALVFAVGRRLGLFAVLYGVLPGMDRFRVPARSLFLASLGAALLAGLGIDVLVRPGAEGCEEGWAQTRRRLRRWVAGIAVFLALGGALKLSGVVPTTPPAERSSFQTDTGTTRHRTDGWDWRGLRAWTRVSSDGVVWGATAAMTLVLAGTGTGAASSRRAGLLLGALALIELTASAQRLLVVSPLERFVEAEKVSTQLKGRLDHPSGPARVAASPRALSDLDAALAGIEKSNTNDSFQLQLPSRLYEELYPFLDDLPRPTRPERPMDGEATRFHIRAARTVVERMGVDWIATTQPGALAGADGFESVEAPAPVRLLNHRQAMPRCYVVPRAELRARPKVPAHLVLSDIDPREAVVLDSDPLPAGDRQPFTPGAWCSDDPDRLVVQVETQAPGLLVVADAWMPGWTATVDGRPEPILSGDFWLRVVPVRQAGRHEVVLSYDPPGLTLGAGISTAATAVWAGMGLVLMSSRKAFRRCGRD